MPHILTTMAYHWPGGLNRPVRESLCDYLSDVESDSDDEHEGVESLYLRAMAVLRSQIVEEASPHQYTPCCINALWVAWRHLGEGAKPSEVVDLAEDLLSGYPQLNDFKPYHKSTLTHLLKLRSNRKLESLRPKTRPCCVIS